MSPKTMKQIIGAAVGVVIGLMILFIGFFRTLLLVALGLAGWWLCGSRTVPQPVKEFAGRVKEQAKILMDRVIHYLTTRH